MFKKLAALAVVFAVALVAGSFAGGVAAAQPETKTTIEAWTSNGGLADVLVLAASVPTVTLSDIELVTDIGKASAGFSSCYWEAQGACNWGVRAVMDINDCHCLALCMDGNMVDVWMGPPCI